MGENLLGNVTGSMKEIDLYNSSYLVFLTTSQMEPLILSISLANLHLPQTRLFFWYLLPSLTLWYKIMLHITHIKVVKLRIFLLINQEIF